MNPETVTTLAALLAILGGGGLAVLLGLIRRPRVLSTLPDSQLQATADRLEVEQVAGIEDAHADDERAILRAVGTDDRRARLERIAALDER